MEIIACLESRTFFKRWREAVTSGANWESSFIRDQGAWLETSCDLLGGGIHPTKIWDALAIYKEWHNDDHGI